MAANDDVELDKIRAAIKAAKMLNLPPDGVDRDPSLITLLNSAESKAGAVPPGEVVTPPMCPAIGRPETGRVSGKDSLRAIYVGGVSRPSEASANGGCPSTKQLRLRLPHVFAAELKQLPELWRGGAFVVLVFGQLGHERQPAEFLGGFEELQRLGILLRQTTVRPLPNDLLGEISAATKTIDKVCRIRRFESDRIRLRLRREYADALLALTPTVRWRIVGLATGANEAAISMQKVARKTPVLHDLRKRLNAQLESGLTVSPEAEVREVLDILRSLQFDQARGGQS